MGRNVEHRASDIARNGNGHAGKVTDSLVTPTTNGVSSTSGPIVHLTAAAAAKAAATALLTNQVIKRVRVTLPDGRNASFKVEKCIIESGSVLCSIVGTRESAAGLNPLEVYVRVAWEPNLTPVEDSAFLNRPLPKVLNQSIELHWLTPKIIASSVKEAQFAIPLLFHFPAASQEKEAQLRDIPRQLLAEAISEVLGSIAPEKMERGVQVVVVLAQDTGERLPNLETSVEVPLFQTNGLKQFLDLVDDPVIIRLGLALDEAGNGLLQLLVGQNEAFINLSNANLSLRTALGSAPRLPNIDTLTLGGTLGSIVAVASGNIDITGQVPFDFNYFSQLANRFDLDQTLVQSLRAVTDPPVLLRMLNHRQLGWVFDRICELACLEIRKNFKDNFRLEVIIFGNSGAILGRAALEPGLLRL